MHLLSKKVFSLLGIVSVSSGVATYSVITGSFNLPAFNFSQEKLGILSKELEDSNKLDLENNNLTDFKVSTHNSKKIESLNIESNDLRNLNIETHFNEGLQPTVRQTLSEVQKESTFQELELSSAKAIREAKSKLTKKELETLQKAAKKYKEYSSSVVPRRRRRSVDNTVSTVKKEKPNLDEQERKALSKYYGEFVKLNEMKTIFSLAMNDVLEEDVEIMREEFVHNQEILRKGINSLKEIRWDYPHLQLFGGNYGAERHDILDPQRVRSWKNIECKDDHCGWSNWEKNPYKNFFKDEAEWKQFISNIISPQQQILDGLDNPGKIACSLLFFPGVNNFVSYYGILWFIRKAYIRSNGSSLKRLNEGDCGTNEQNWLFRNIQEAKTDLQYRIGSKLLERMNLLN